MTGNVKLRRARAAVGLAVALARFRAEWRGHPESPWALYGLLGDPGQPWRMPSALYRVPYIPIRLYLRAGDAALFRAWYQTHRVMEWLTNKADPEYVDRVMRQRVNDDLALRDHLGIAPDGGSFDVGDGDPSRGG